MSTLIPVDAIDLKLLDELQRDASRSNQAIDVPRMPRSRR